MTRPRPRRPLLVASALLLLTAILVVVFVLRLASSPDAKVQLGDEVFTVGQAEVLAARIERDGVPLLFQDLLGRDRDIYVVHRGEDATTGWRAFQAQRRGQPRRCQLLWQRDDEIFLDPCTGTSHATGDISFPVTVRDGIVEVDLRTASR